MRAVDREALAPIRPIVLVLHYGAGALALVSAHAPQPLAGTARVHPEGHLLLVLFDGERAGLRSAPAARVRPPGGRKQMHDFLAVALVNLLDAALPVALHRPAL